MGDFREVSEWNYTDIELKRYQRNRVYPSRPVKFCISGLGLALKTGCTLKAWAFLGLNLRLLVRRSIRMRPCQF